MMDEFTKQVPGRLGAETLIDEEELKATRADLAHASHLPGHYYTSPEILELEIEKLFMRDWLVVGRVEEFPNPGDYRAMDIAGESILICRDADGGLNALANVCRHRGVEIAFGEGNRKDFQCPYHGWLYDLTGQLIAAPHAEGFGKFDVKTCRLPRLKIDTWAGFIFINFDEEAPTLNEFLEVDGAREAASFLHAEDTRLVDTYTYEVPCNWKLVPENLIDIYHVNVIHVTSFGKHFKPENFPFQLTKYGWNAEYESNTMAPDGELLFGPMPWLEDKHARFAFTLFLRPNFNMFARQDLLQPWVTYPIAPDRSLVTIFTLLPQQALEMPAFEAKVKILRDFIEQTVDEDMVLLRSIQKGFNSRRYRAGPIHEMEAAIHHRLNTYIDALKGRGEAR